MHPHTYVLYDWKLWWIGTQNMFGGENIGKLSIYKRLVDENFGESISNCQKFLQWKFLPLKFFTTQYILICSCYVRTCALMRLDLWKEVLYTYLILLLYRGTTLFVSEMLSHNFLWIITFGKATYQISKLWVKHELCYIRIFLSWNLKMYKTLL